MFSPVTKVLIKIFAHGFYKVHAGLLLFLFVVIFSHCFWMKPLGGHLTHEESIFYHLIMMITFVNDPVMMTLVFITWFVYCYKSWSYVGRQLLATENHFLLYSITSMARINQFKSWFFVQLIIFLPAIVYGISAVVVGIAFQYYVIPVIILIYLLLLISISAFIYVGMINRLIKTGNQPYLFKIINNWKKPFFSLSIYHVFDKMKLGFLLTKVFSWLIISGTYVFFSDVKQDFRLAGVVILLIVVAHAFFIFQNQRFEETYLSFSRNFPYTKLKLFLSFAGVYLVLTLPESIWMVSKFNPAQALELLLFGLSTALLFRSLLYWTGLSVTKYLPRIFSLLILFFFVIMFGYFWILPPLNLAVSYWIFHKNYYRQSYIQ